MTPDDHDEANTLTQRGYQHTAISGAAFKSDAEAAWPLRILPRPLLNVVFHHALIGSEQAVQLQHLLSRRLRASALNH